MVLWLLPIQGELKPRSQLLQSQLEQPLLLLLLRLLTVAAAVAVSVAADAAADEGVRAFKPR